LIARYSTGRDRGVWKLEVDGQTIFIFLRDGDDGRFANAVLTCPRNPNLNFGDAAETAFLTFVLGGEGKPAEQQDKPWIQRCTPGPDPKPTKPPIIGIGVFNSDD